MRTDENNDPRSPPTRQQLRRLAGARSFERGEAYFADGAVRSIARRDTGVEARVAGTRTYRVRLWFEGGNLGYSCTCPVGNDDSFCKHCVAVGLTWKDGGLAGGEVAEAAPIREEDLRAYLLSLDKDALAAFVLELADGNERLHRSLMLRAGQWKDPDAGVLAWKEAFSEALETYGYVYYGDVISDASEVAALIESLDDLLRQGQAKSVIRLAEHGLSELEERLEEFDDSDGEMSGMLDRLQELHLDACRIARPDPVDLAERLFEWEMDADYGTFYGAAGTYSDVLGAEGLAAYRRLAEREWSKVPELGPEDPDTGGYGKHFRITSIMEMLAAVENDIEALAAARSRDLSRPYNFLRVAETYHDAGRFEQALQWAERGWNAFPEDQQDERLRTFLAEAYQACGRVDDAVQLAWQALALSPDLAGYRQLESHAKRAGQWPEWRERALSLIRQGMTDASAESLPLQTWSRYRQSGHSLLVEIFLHEGDVEAAWREARTGGCSERLWLTLAEHRAETHPADALKVYENHIADLLKDTGDRIYRETVAYLTKMEALYARVDDEEAFLLTVKRLRAEQKRKRNLMKLLDSKGW